MRKITSVIAILILVFAGAYGSLFAYSEAFNRAGEKTILALMHILEEAKRTNGSYPVAVEETEAFRNAQEKVWGIFPGPKMAYRLNGQEFDIYYYQRPLGPHHGYKSGVQEWYFEE